MTYNQQWLDDTKLPPTVLFRLNKYGVYTIEQLLTCSESELLAVTGIGPFRLKKIKKMLEDGNYGELPIEELPSIDGPDATEHRKYLDLKYRS